MKKVLFATTALVMTAGAAAAEVAVGGNGRMGIVYDGSDWNFSSRIRITFSASGETDGGLAFGGSVRADNYEDDQATNGAEGNVWISGAFGKIAMGDVDSAAEAAVGQVSGVGYTSMGSGQSITYIGAGASSGDPAMLYTYSAGDISLYLSAKDGNSDEAYGVGLKYSMGDYWAGLGFESTNSADGWYLGGGATFGAATVTAVYGDDDSLGQQYAISLDYGMGATTVTAYYKDTEFSLDPNYGLGVAYDLGGGAKVKAGVGSLGGVDRADVGLTFSF